MTNEIEQGLHEKLCAFVLGEASDEVRVEVEKALEESADLRAERERLEETIGLVKEAMAGSESLPPSAAAEILADARTPRQRPWYARPALPIAAGIAAITMIGILAFRTSVHVHQSKVSVESQLAMNERDLDERKLRQVDEPMIPVNKAPAGTVSAPPAAESVPAVVASSTQAIAPVDQPVIDSTTLDRLDVDQLSAKVGFYDEKKEASIDRSGATQPSAGGSEVELADAGVRGSAAIGVGSGGTPAPSARRSFRSGTSAGAPSAKGGTSAPITQPLYYTWRDTTLRVSGDSKDGRVASEGGARLLNQLGYVSGDDEGEVLGRDLSILDQLRRLDPPDREKWIEGECQRIVTYCRRRPNERPRDMFYRFYGDNAFELAAFEPLSTFSVDVDTASYTLARRYLNEGHIPEKAQVRTEEFINYFKADVPAPTQGTFAIHTDLAPSRYSSDKARSMLRVVVRGREVAKEQRKPLNLTFVIDVSGSMREQNRLEMVKHAVRLLVGELGSGDNLAIVAFSDDARLVLPMTSVRNRSAIETALEPLQPENSTNSEAGLKLGYATALTNINPEAQNRVVFLSDGVANVGETDPVKLSETIKPIREKGIYLNTIGVGMNNHNDTLLDQLADKGDGVSSYIDTPDEARRVIVDGFTGAFQTIARDVKIQVEFDPAQVERYRLLGYESRAIANKDFRNDKIDAGEVGAGHQVTALYEIERTAGASEKPIATVRLRWKAPRSVNAPTANEEATEIAEPVLASRQTSFEGAGTGYRRAVIVAQFAEFLRRSVHARGDSLDALITDAEKLAKETTDPELGELVVLMHKSKQLILNALPPCDDLCQTIDAVRRNELLRSEREMLAKELDGKLVTDLEKQNADLERQIRDLLRRKLEQKVK
jgi:Ca-activated chloride channel family protein